MSIFRKITLACPACSEDVEFDAVHSVNADRRADLREAILSGTFQYVTCKHCQVGFRLDPEFTYLDLGRGQWIASFAYGDIGNWEQIEARARASFDRGYGPAAPAVARELGARLTPRLTFGWGALREKIFAAANNLSDIDLELTKIAVLNNAKAAPVTAKTELRLADVQGQKLIMVWVVAETNEVAEGLSVPRELYDEIAADKTGWKLLREELHGRLFVDMQRLMLPVEL